MDGTEDPAEFRTYMDHLNRNRVQAEQLIEADPVAAFGGFRALARGEAITPEWLIALAPSEVAEQLK